jgi:hypothetical protein
MIHQLRLLISSVLDPVYFCKEPDPDPTLFINDPQDAYKKYFFSQLFFAYYFLKIHLHHSSKVKGHKEVTKQ